MRSQPSRESFRLTSFPFDSAELLGGEKRLRQKPFQPAGACDDLAVFRGKLFQPEHGDDILEFLILGQWSCESPARVCSAVRPTMPAVAIFELDCSASIAGKALRWPACGRARMDAERCENTCTAAGSVKSSAGTYTA